MLQARISNCRWSSSSSSFCIHLPVISMLGYNTATFSNNVEPWASAAHYINCLMAATQNSGCVLNLLLHPRIMAFCIFLFLPYIVVGIEKYFTGFDKSSLYPHSKSWCKHSSPWENPHIPRVYYRNKRYWKQCSFLQMYSISGNGLQFTKSAITSVNNQAFPSHTPLILKHVSVLIMHTTGGKYAQAHFHQGRKTQILGNSHTWKITMQTNSGAEWKNEVSQPSTK